MKTGKKLALVLGLAAGAVLAAVATKSTKKVRQHITKKTTADNIKTDGFDESEAYYI